MQDYSQLFQALQEVSDETSKHIDGFFVTKKQGLQKNDTILQEILETVQAYATRGGKHLRPFLCWCGYFLGTEEKNADIFRAAASIELFHRYLLSLDDMADRDELRHGGPTLEKAFYKKIMKIRKEEALHYGRSLSEIAGGLLSSYAYEMLRSSRFDPKRIVEAIGEINTYTMEDAVAGWNIHFRQNLQPLGEVDVDEFLRGLQLVSAHYTFVGPLMTGAILSGKSDQLKNGLMAYGKNAGMGFQIQDDILGLFGEPDETGKAVGNDVREGKKTLLVQIAYQRAERKNRIFLQQAVGNPKLTLEEVKKVQTIVIDTGSLEYSQKLAKEYAEKGVEALKNVKTENQEILNHLKDLAYFVIERKN